MGKECFILKTGRDLVVLVYIYYSILLVYTSVLNCFQNIIKMCIMPFFTFVLNDEIFKLFGVYQLF